MSLGVMQHTRLPVAGTNFDPGPMLLADPRADDQRRTVHLFQDRVTIDRNYCGVAMRLSIPVDAYQGVCVGLRQIQRGGVVYELRLAHRDADLSVSLGEAMNDADIWADWQAWARFFGLPTLIERNEGLVEWGHAPGKVAPAALKSPSPLRRRTKRRRAAFITRRQKTRAIPAKLHREVEMIARD